MDGSGVEEDAEEEEDGDEEEDEVVVRGGGCGCACSAYYSENSVSEEIRDMRERMKERD